MIEELADELDRALTSRSEIAPLTRTHGDFDLPTAYAVQALGVQKRLGRGEKIVGYKMGLTSEAKRVQMNLGSPIYGVLTDAMRVEHKLRAGDGVHPKIEPEIAFVTSKELSGRPSPAEAFEAIATMGPALEILDSRFVGFKYFSLPDVVADNSSSWRFVLGPQSAPRNPGGLQMRMLVDGVVKQEASSDAISGNPLLSLVQLVWLLQKPLPAGSIVLAGAATVAEPLRPGMRVELQVDELGAVAVDVE